MMINGSFTFNGVSSDSMGIKFQKCPSRPFPNKKVLKYKILGRDGDLLVDYDSYENVIQEYEVYVTYDNNESSQEKMTKIANWLLSPHGYAVLTDSFDSSVYRDARCVNFGAFANALNLVGYGTIQFDCCPQRYPVSAEIYETTNTGDITYNYQSIVGINDGFPRLTINNLNANCAVDIYDSNGLHVTIPARGQAIGKTIIDWQSRSVINQYNNSRPYGTSDTGNWGKIGNGGWIRIVFTGQYGETLKIETRRFYI